MDLNLLLLVVAIKGIVDISQFSVETLMHHLIMMVLVLVAEKKAHQKISTFMVVS